MALWRIFHHWRSHPELVQQAGNNSTQHVPPSLKYYIPLLAESLVCGGVGGAILQMAGGFALSYVVAHMSSSPFMAAANVAGIPKIFPIPVQLFSSGMLATCIGTRAPQ